MISPSRDFHGHTVVIADCDHDALRRTKQMVQAQGLRAICASSKDNLFDCVESVDPAAIVVDCEFDGEDHTAVLRDTCRRAGGKPVIVVSRTRSLRHAVVAMQNGAAEYLAKPLDVQELLEALNHVLKDRVEHRPGLATHHVSGIDRILGSSAAIEHVRQLIREVASTDATSLVIGESGTGKELVARAIHAQGSRCRQAFVAVNMAALPSGLVESVLFGHVRGAFTGADSEHTGCCAQADNGTLFLDEISEMDVTLQAKLLRFLQDQTFQRVGASELQKVDTRIIAAANQDPVDLVASGRLRDDLYYRLNVFPIEIPPLRSRLDDIPVLVEHFLESAARVHSKRSSRLSARALRALCEYTWPGNVRQLENVIQRLVIRNQKSTIDLDALPAEVLGDRPLAGFSSALTRAIPRRREIDKEQDLRTIDYVEKNAIVEALTTTGGNVTTAARMLGLGQATVYRKIKRYEITLAYFRSDDEAARAKVPTEQRRA